MVCRRTAPAAEAALQDQRKGGADGIVVCIIIIAGSMDSEDGGTREGFGVGYLEDAVSDAYCWTRCREATSEGL